jgi:DNA-binding XRE family transcriptional regulator
VSKLKSYAFEDVLRREMRDKEFAAEYEALGKEYELAKEFVRLRKAQKLTQAELARRAGTSQPAIARLESGTYRNLSLSFLRRVAGALRAVPEVRLRRLSSKRASRARRKASASARG